MAVTMLCPNLSCGRPVSAPENARGKVVRCAHCSQPFLVPAAAVATSEPAPAEARPDKKAGKR